MGIPPADVDSKIINRFIFCTIWYNKQKTKTVPIAVNSNVK
jgi:hypothetical protein